MKNKKTYFVSWGYHSTEYCDGPAETLAEARELLEWRQYLGFTDACIVEENYESRNS